MRRNRRDETKVWHNPDLDTYAKRRSAGGSGGLPTPPTVQERKEAKKHRAALEALFAPRKEPEAAPGDTSEGGERAVRGAKGAGAGAAGKNGRRDGPARIVLAPPPESDPKAAERQRLLARFLLAEGRPSISRAADAFISAGFAFPEEQDVCLQLLEHTDERHVCSAIDSLCTLLAGELPKRRAVLESRLRRIEELADDPATRASAARLRRQVSGRPEAPGGGRTEGVGGG